MIIDTEPEPTEEVAEPEFAFLCAACDDRDEYATDFHWQTKTDWPMGQKTLTCDECGSDRLYVVKATP